MEKSFIAIKLVMLTLCFHFSFEAEVDGTIQATKCCYEALLGGVETMQAKCDPTKLASGETVCSPDGTKVQIKVQKSKIDPSAGSSTTVTRCYDNGTASDLTTCLTIVEQSKLCSTWKAVDNAALLLCNNNPSAGDQCNGVSFTADSKFVLFQADFPPNCARTASFPVTVTTGGSGKKIVSCSQVNQKDSALGKTITFIQA